MMARAILFPASHIYIMSLTAGQAQDTFRKMEDIAKHNISSAKNDNCIFASEVVKSSNSDGFIHKAESYSTKLFNGSTITTLVGKAESIIGKRSDLSVYDEAGVITKDFFARTEPFTTQSKDFFTGDGVDLGVYPTTLPTQNLYLSSAGDTNGRLWEVYKDCAKRIMMGYDDCFVADINCEIPLNPTMHGKPYAPLFDRRNVEAMMRTNPYRALRELGVRFERTNSSHIEQSVCAFTLNCWKEIPKANKPKRRDEICSNVTVTKVEKSCWMVYG